jgi:hypothetical protein
MIPTRSNHTQEGCVTTSSNCVIWQGPDITCINLCKGDTVSDVVAKLATELCEVLEYVNVSAYDLSCLDLSVQPTTFEQLMQLIITRICNIQTEVDNIISEGTSGGGNSSGCPDNCLINLPACLQYEDDTTGNQVSTTTLTNFVQLLGSRFCLLFNQVTLNTEAIEQIAGDVEVLQNTVNNLEDQIGTLPNVNINCITGTTSTPITTAVQTLATTICDIEAQIDSLGGNDVTQAILNQCPGLPTSNVLVGSGTMGQISGWISNPTTVADSLSNLWITVCDMRTAVQNILTNCCSSICTGLSIQMDISYNSLANTVSIDFTGIIPSGLTSNPSLTALSISQPGFAGQIISVPIQTLLNSTPFTFTPSVGLNMLSTFVISGSFNAESVEDTCTTSIVGIYTPTAECPILTLTPNSDSIDWSFTSISSTSTYQMQIWNSAQTTLLGVFPIAAVTGPVSGSFTSLVSGTTYAIRIGYDVTGGTRYVYCPFTTVTTTVLSCLPADTASGVINITFGG